MPSNIRPSSRKNRFFESSLTISLAVIFIVVLLATISVALNLLGNSIFSGHDSWSTPALSGAVPTSTVTLSTGPLQSSSGPTPTGWNGKDRINVLIMGLDYRDWESYDIPRSDTMILLTLDPATHTVGMLSIPRDMWVDIPGHYAAKINTAYFLGEAEHLPGGGAGLAMKTVAQFLGVPVNYYAQIDFKAFSGFVDEIGGISIDVPEDITVDPLGPGNTVNLKAGTQHMFGPVALAYARARYTANGDFDRANRQQQVIIGIRNRVLKPNVWPTIIANAPGIYQDLAAGIHTNLTLDQTLKLALIARQIPIENIKRGVIAPDMVTFSTSYDGQDILLPNTELILQLRDQILSTDGASASLLVTDQPTSEVQVQPTIGSVATEKARISVQNGTFTSGLAALTSDYLKTLGLNVVEQSNADAVPASMLIVYSNTPYTTALLAKTLNIPSSRIYSRQDSNVKIDIVLVLGEDWNRNNTLPPQ
jgi:polyisoprenyl-teichoic acid--peptidoglycan teichoic acid transferase